MEINKTCTKCGVEKSLEEFYKQKTGKYGRTAQCKACFREYQLANRDKISAQQKAWREVNPDYSKARYQSNKDKISARNKNWREANRDKFAECNKAYRKKRYAEDIEFRTMCLLRNQTSRLREHKDVSTIKLVSCSPEEFWKRNGSPCMEKLKNLDIDHIVPLSWFDLTNPDHVRVACHWTNLQYLGRSGNESKRNRYAGRPDAILGYRDEFDLEKHVSDMIEFLNETK